MKHLYLLISTLFFLNTYNQISAQPAFEKVYYEGSGEQIYQTSDGGYQLLTADKVTKTDENGNLISTKTINEPLNHFIPTSDGGFIKTGNIDILGDGQTDILLVKMNAHGTPVWTKFLVNDQPESANAVYQTADGGYLIVGEIQQEEPYDFSGNLFYFNDLLLIKTNQFGNEQWRKVVGDIERNESGKLVTETSDGNFIALATRPMESGPSTGSPGLFILKTDAAGNELEQYAEGNPGIGYQPKTLKPSDDGGYIIGGNRFSYSPHGGNALYIIKRDGSSNWTYVRGGSQFEIAYGNVGTPTPDGGAIVSGYYSNYFMSIPVGTLFKVDADGMETWRKAYPEPANDIVLTTDDGFAMTGSRFGKLNLVKTGSDGNLDLSQYVDLGLQLTPDNNNLITGEIRHLQFELTNDNPVATATATNIVVSVPLPDAFQLNSFSSSSGNFLAGSETWEISSLASGATATLDLYLEVVNDNFNVDYYAQVMSANPLDINSGYANHVCCLTPENDEVYEIFQNFDCSGTKNLYSQAAVDAFAACPFFDGNILVSGFNSPITNLAGLSNLEEVTGSFSIFHTELTNLNDLNNLKKVGELVINENDELLNLQGLEGIQKVEQNLIISENPILNNLQGLNNLTEVGNILTIGESSLITLEGLNNLTTIGDRFNIRDNEQLLEINALSKLTFIGRTLWIYSNEVLTNLDGLSQLEEVGLDILIQDNPVLSDCCGLYSVVAFDSYGGTLQLTGNPAACSSKQEILDNCGSDCVNSIAGFTLLGDFAGHRYFVSDAAYTWQNAQQIAATKGGYLISLNGEQENDFLKQHISQIVFIGLSDAQSEGNLVWDSGEPLAYSNLSICDWCGLNSEENDFGKMNFWDGTWSFDNEFVRRPFVMELVCGEDCVCPTDYTPVCGSDGVTYTNACIAECAGVFDYTPGECQTGCPTTIAGYEYLGTWNGHQYFLSENRLPWWMAETQAMSIGGYLPSIGSAAENDFLQQNISEIVWFGMNDNNVEGQVEWSSGEALTYTNYSTCDFCGDNTEENDYGEFNYWDGSWSWDEGGPYRKYLVEIPCPSSSFNIALLAPAKAENEKVVVEQIFPNPACNNIFTKIESTTETETLLQVYDGLGKLYLEKKVLLYQGRNHLELDISTLPSGVYMLLVKGERMNISQTKFVKQRM